MPPHLCSWVAGRISWEPERDLEFLGERGLGDSQWDGKTQSLEPKGWLRVPALWYLHLPLPCR